MFGFGFSRAVAAPPVVQWHYYLQDDPWGQPDGWYEYDVLTNLSVEQLYQTNQTTGGSSKHVLSTAASSGFTYELDFQRMTQCNLATRKMRPIFRTCNGQLPSTPPQVVGIGTATAVHRARLTYVAPERLHELLLDEAKVFVDMAPPKDGAAATTSYATAAYDDDCVICLDNLWGDDTARVVAIRNCEHRFHYQCIHEALTKGGGKCPLCSKSIPQDQNSQTSKGGMPSGTMFVEALPHQPCSGFDTYGTLEISYWIPDGVQKDYHPQPGFSFVGARRMAYLPDSAEGQDILARMEFAFMHGWTFMVGTSLTTGRANTITWASIHHKTSKLPGPYGYPDPTYFDRCNGEMNQLGIPPPNECRTWLQKKSQGYDT